MFSGCNLRSGLHSFRSGVASRAANMGIDDRIFKKHGRWRSETAKDGYVTDDLKSISHLFFPPNLQKTRTFGLAIITCDQGNN